MRCLALLLLLLLTVLGASGCRVGGPSKTDPLVIELVALRSKVTELELENAELKTKVARATAEAGQSAEAGLAAPELASLQIDRYSGWLTPQPGQEETLRVYIAAFDARRRDVQINGWLHVEARTVEGSVLSTRTLNPAELRDAYRGGFMGPVYVVELPATRPSDSVIVIAALSSMPSGEPFARAERTIAAKSTSSATTGSTAKQ